MWVRGLALSLAVMGLVGCKDRDRGQPAGGGGTAAQVPADAEVVVLSQGDLDSVQGARLALEAALRLPTALPLPYPRVEHHGDRFRVVLGRGKFGGLRPLLATLGKEAQVVRAGEGGNDDVIRLGIICTEGGDVPLFDVALPAAGDPREIGRVGHGKVLVLKEEEDLSPEGGSEEVERGFVHVLAPRAGMVRSTDLLLPPDCTPRDEDNDDGNGRLLSGGRLCLTTRFSGKDGEVNRATLIAVTPSYRRCTRFSDAGTFDSFDQDPTGTQFAVEDRAARGSLQVFDVGPDGKLLQRFRLPGLLRPAYLAQGLVATVEDGAGQGLVVIDNGHGALRGPVPAAPPVPARIFNLTGDRFQPAAPTYRPAAPTLREGKVVVSFQQGCQKAEQRRVRSVARKDFEQCLLEVEVEVGLDGKGAKRRCSLNNAPSSLEEPLGTPCR